VTKKRRHRPGGRSAIFGDINVTPLVDVVLVLLIVFMVVAPYLARGKEVRLPWARNIDASEGDIVQVTLRDDGSLWLGADPIEREDLVRSVRAQLAGPETPEIVLRADATLKYREVMLVFETLKAAGISDVGLSATLPPEDG
jgi:biopolymer transport protein TolR